MNFLFFDKLIDSNQSYRLLVTLYIQTGAEYHNRHILENIFTAKHAEFQCYFNCLSFLFVMPLAINRHCSNLWKDRFFPSENQSPSMPVYVQFGKYWKKEATYNCGPYLLSRCTGVQPNLGRSPLRKEGTISKISSSRFRPLLGLRIRALSHLDLELLSWR